MGRIKWPSTPLGTEFLRFHLENSDPVPLHVRALPGAPSEVSKEGHRGSSVSHPS